MNHLHVLSDPILEQIEQKALNDHIPIIDRSSIHLIRSYVLAMQNVTRILEIGTAVGYSTIWLAEAAEQAHVDSIERDEGRVNEARENVNKKNIASRISIYIGDALELLPAWQGVYDVIFIDAAKGQYQRFFELCMPLLRQGGVIISDNVFFKGYVCQDSNDEVPKKWKAIVKKIRKYNELLRDHPQFETTFVSVGDGLAFSIKKE